MFSLGIMVALTPSIIVLAVLLWRVRGIPERLQAGGACLGSQLSGRPE
jgi:hypothetical protein